MKGSSVKGGKTLKRRLTVIQYDFLKRELSYLQQLGKLDEQQVEEMLSSYEVEKIKREKTKINFVQVLTVIGAILIGLGILSFVASNWSGLSDLSKFAILLFALIATYIIARILEINKPLFAKSLYYIGIFAFGAEIFYIGQLFHLGGSVGNALLAWSIGAFSLAYYLKDKFVYAFSFFLLYLFIEIEFMLTPTPSYWLVLIIPLLFVIGHYFFKQYKVLLVANFLLLYQFIELKFVIEVIENNEFPYVLTILIPLLFYSCHKWMKQSQSLFFINIVLLYQWMALVLDFINMDKLVYYVIPYFIIGLIMSHKQLPSYKDVMKTLGYVTQFFAGLLLTFKVTWQQDMIFFSEESSFPFWVIFGILYMVYGFWLVYRGKLVGIVIVSALIFRFYVDLSLVFMNKSIAFFIGGILLLVLGYWFEKTRRGESKRGKPSTD